MENFQNFYLIGYIDEYDTVYFDLPLKLKYHGIDNLEKIVKNAKELFDNSFYKKVVVFQITEVEFNNPDIIDWDFIESHKVKEFEE